MRSMVYCDANVILRYLLRDDKTLVIKARKLIDNGDLFILNEVLAEIVYVLIKVYSVEKKKVCGVLKELCTRENMHFHSKDVIQSALDIFSNNNLDFVDCILCAHSVIDGATIASLDAKVNKFIKRKGIKT